MWKYAVLLTSVLSLGNTAIADLGRANTNIYYLQQSAIHLARLADQFEDAVVQRYRGSIVVPAADNFEHAADHFLDSIQDRDYRDIPRDFAILQRSFANLYRAFRSCPYVPRDLYLQQMWNRLSISYQQVSGLMIPQYNNPQPGYPGNYPQQPVNPRHNPHHQNPNYPQQYPPQQYQPQYPQYPNGYGPQQPNLPRQPLQSPYPQQRDPRNDPRRPYPH